MYIKLSSFKKNHGLKELLNPEDSTYWHTDSSLPHLIELSFSKKTHINCVNLLLKYNDDDSYTPKNIEVKIGNTRDTMISINKYRFKEPSKWVTLKINSLCIFVYIIIINNHQDGKDSRVRNIKVFNNSGDEILCMNGEY